jgi:hypothetical protein
MEGRNKWCSLTTCRYITLSEICNSSDTSNFCNNIRLPKAEPLPKKYRADFKLKSQPLLAQLDSLNNVALALNNE